MVRGNNHVPFIPRTQVMTYVAPECIVNAVPTPKPFLARVSEVASKVCWAIRLSVKAAGVNPTAPHLLNLERIRKVLHRHPAKHISKISRVLPHRPGNKLKDR